MKPDSSSLGDATMVRRIAEQIGEAVADVAIDRYAKTHPETKTKMEIPPPLKWFGIIASAVLTLGVTGMAAWTVTTLNELQLTVARIDERQQQDTTGKQIDALTKRVEQLESYHRTQTKD